MFWFVVTERKVKQKKSLWLCPVSFRWKIRPLSLCEAGVWRQIGLPYLAPSDQCHPMQNSDFTLDLG